MLLSKHFTNYKQTWPNGLFLPQSSELLFIDITREKNNNKYY